MADSCLKATAKQCTEDSRRGGDSQRRVGRLRESIPTAGNAARRLKYIAIAAVQPALVSGFAMADRRENRGQSPVSGSPAKRRERVREVAELRIVEAMHGLGHLGVAVTDA